MVSAPRSRPNLWAALVLFLASLLVPVPQGHAQAPSPVPLVGTGSWGVHPEMADWGAALAKAPSPVALTYTPQGTGRARTAFLRGEADFVVSGVGFTAAERDQLARAGREVLEIPLQGAALAVLLRPPAGGLAQAGTEPAVPYRGPVRMLPLTLARSVLTDANAWTDPDLAQAMGTRLHPTPSRLEPVLRSDPTDASHYLGVYLRTVAPELWKAAMAARKLPADHLAEQWPVPSPAARPGLREVVEAVAAAGSGDGGAIGLVPPWAVADARSRFPEADLRVVQLRNGSGEWVEPTPAAVTAALSAGGGAPLGGLSGPAPGAYPLSWVDHLYVATTGLAPGKAEAVAALVRHAVTAGRAATEAHGDASLPDFLAAEALRGADALVRASCTGAGATVATTAGPEPYAAGAAAAPGLRCERGAAAPPAPPPGDQPASLPAQPEAPAAASAAPAPPPHAAPVPGEAPPAGPPAGSAILPFGDPVQVAPDAPDGPAPQAAARLRAAGGARTLGTMAMSGRDGAPPRRLAGLLLAAAVLGAAPGVVARRSGRRTSRSAPPRT